MPVVRNAVGYLSFLTLFGHQTGEHSFLPLDALAVVWICILLFNTQGFLKILSTASFCIAWKTAFAIDFPSLSPFPPKNWDQGKPSKEDKQHKFQVLSDVSRYLVQFHVSSQKKGGTLIRWKPSWCWISTSTARFDPTTFRLGNQKTVPLVEMFRRKKYDVFLVVKNWRRLSLTICPLKTAKYCGSQWGIKASSNGTNLRRTQKGSNLHQGPIW